MSTISLAHAAAVASMASLATNPPHQGEDVWEITQPGDDPWADLIMTTLVPRRRQKRVSKDYRGRIGLKDLKRRLSYWEARVADFAALSADATGPAKTKANKLLKSGREILATIEKEVSRRQAA